VTRFGMSLSEGKKLVCILSVTTCMAKCLSLLCLPKFFTSPVVRGFPSGLRFGGQWVLGMTYRGIKKKYLEAIIPFTKSAHLAEVRPVKRYFQF